MLPDASVTVPRLAVMVPELRTPGATSAAKPPLVAVILPPIDDRGIRPARDVELVGPGHEVAVPDVARRRQEAGGLDHRAGAEDDSVAVDDEHPPVRVDAARICDGPSPPVTRFRIAADELGWMNCARSPVPTLNVFQFTIAFWLDWFTITCDEPCPLIVAAPPTTVPPLGARQRRREHMHQGRGGEQQSAHAHRSLPQYFAPRMRKARQSWRGPSTALEIDRSAV